MANPVAERIANIGAGERRKRLLFGVFALLVGVVIAGLLIAVASPILWRLPLILVFYAGALGVFQSLDKT
jgi:fatty acid desaturase